MYKDEKSLDKRISKSYLENIRNLGNSLYQGEYAIPYYYDAWCLPAYEYQLLNCRGKVTKAIKRNN